MRLSSSRKRFSAGLSAPLPLVFCCSTGATLFEVSKPDESPDSWIESAQKRLIEWKRQKSLIFRMKSIKRFWADSIQESGDSRSEEHTSELQSRSDLVCRLLLEK